MAHSIGPSSSSSSPTPAHLSVNGQFSTGANPTPQPQTPSLTRLDSASDHVTVIYPTPRPSSLPSSSSLSFPGPLFSPPTPTTEISRFPQPDSLQRYSSASLPLPHQIPFHALPKSSVQMGLPFPPSLSSNDLSSSPECRPAIRSTSVDEICSSSSSSSSASTNGTTSSSSSLDPDLPPASPTKLPSIPLPSSPNPSNDPSTQRPPSRPVSPFRAPQPPSSPSHSSRFQPSDFATAMRRFISPSYSHPHTSHPSSPSPPSTTDPLTYLTYSYSNSYPPPPDPPVILPAEPPDDNINPNDITQSPSSTGSSSSTRSRATAPYMPFLSHAPPPPDCCIEVETTHSEYRLNVRLPGFSREGITLATKRRRILHVVANRWDNGGGHFERRISFGYDADLIQVRAEFDGVMLRIFIPRRVSPVNWYGRPGPIGRA